jgi:phosphatidylglycerol lysyltransferase
MAELSRLNADWAVARGGEQGLTMGRFDPAYVAGQRVYVARRGLRPIGFATFHTAAAGWSLDLLRPHPDAPDGTAHALVAAALADAARAGVTRLSLAAVPEPAFPGRRTALSRLIRLFPGAARSARGLWQFKQAFAPRWERLYLIAPGFAAMALAGWDIRRAVTHPPPVASAVPTAMTMPDGAVGMENPVAQTGSAWQRGRH